MIFNSDLDHCQNERLTERTNEQQTEYLVFHNANADFYINYYDEMIFFSPHFINEDTLPLVVVVAAIFFIFFRCIILF